MFPDDETTPVKARPAITERSVRRIGLLDEELYQLAAKDSPDRGELRRVLVSAFDLGNEVGALPVHEVAAERDRLVAELQRLRSELADARHTNAALTAENARRRKRGTLPPGWRR